jgi:phosphomevalonate kinase
VHVALQRTLQLVLEKVATETVRSILGAGLDVAIVGDNDFYSQRKQLEARSLPPTTASLRQLPKFLPTGVSIRDVHKTGLGSSAALITSLVCALLLRFGVVARASLMQGADEKDEGRRLAHNLAQYVHCLAQGKVGSGFDVSSAIFGSHIYTRFDPAVIQGLMSDEVRAAPLSLSPWAYTHTLSY